MWLLWMSWLESTSHCSCYISSFAMTDFLKANSGNKSEKNRAILTYRETPSIWEACALTIGLLGHALDSFCLLTASKHYNVTCNVMYHVTVMSCLSISMFLSVPAREAVFNCGLKIDSLVSVNLRCNMMYFTSVILISQSQAWTVQG